ncbi:MAG: SHOCT domain-containing protein [Sulfurimonas sp.]|nr:SHOCT domain-containing protein [Sulfurimonas sp.]
MMYDFGPHGFGMWIGWFIPVLIIFIIFYMFQNKDDNLSAKDILDKRYANGEIDDEEYKKKRDAIK